MIIQGVSVVVRPRDLLDLAEEVFALFAVVVGVKLQNRTLIFGSAPQKFGIDFRRFARLIGSEDLRLPTCTFYRGVRLL